MNILIILLIIIFQLIIIIKLSNNIECFDNINIGIKKNINNILSNVNKILLKCNTKDKKIQCPISSIKKFSRKNSIEKGISNIPIYVINIDRNKHRWLNFNNLANKQDIKLIRFAGIDGLNHVFNKKEKKLFNYSYFNIGKSRLRRNVTKMSMLCEKGCALSHYYLWLEIIKANISKCIICEDDIIFSKNFIRYINNLDMENYDLIYLYYSIKDFKTNYKKKITKLNKNIWIGAGNSCYLINYKGVKKLVNIIKTHGMNNPIDWIILNNYKVLNIGVSSKRYVIVNHSYLSSIDYS